MKKILFTTALVVSSLVAGSNAFAIVEPRSATVQIVTPLVMSAGTNPVFGKIQRPSAGSTSIVRLTAAGANSVPSGNALFLGTPTVGSYSITGDSTENITITVAGRAAEHGLSLAFPTGTLSYNGIGFTSGSSAPPPTNTGKTLVVGGELTIVESGVDISGPTPVPFDVTITYQ